MVYDSGSIFEPKILDIKPEDLRASFMAGVRNVAAVSLQIGYPTVASVPHSVINGFKNLLAVAAVTDITFKEAETVKEFIKVRNIPTNSLPHCFHDIMFDVITVFYYDCQKCDIY